jgi:hypothetical protein
LVAGFVNPPVVHGSTVLERYEQGVSPSRNLPGAMLIDKDRNILEDRAAAA